MDACTSSMDSSITNVDNSATNMVTSTFMKSSIDMNSSADINSSANMNSSTNIDSPIVMHTSKRHRKANYSSYAIDVLVSEVAARQLVLFSRSGRPNASNEHKLREWEKVAARMNLVCNTPRSVREVRKKWHTYCSEVRRKAIKRRRQLESHIGTAIHLDTREEKVLALIATIDDHFLSMDICDVDSTSDDESFQTDSVLTIKHELDTDDSFVVSPKSESSASLPIMNTYASQGVTAAVHAGNTPHRRTPPQLRDLEISDADAGADAGTHTQAQVNGNFSTSVNHVAKPILVVPHNTSSMVYTHALSYIRNSTPAVPPEDVTNPSQSTDAWLQVEQAKVAMDRDRLAVDQERLALERELLKVKRCRLVVEDKKLKVAQQQLRRGRRGHTSHALYNLFGELLK